jgi:AcrR family transcriptional regulator
VPKLWNETIEVHRREVTEAILDTTSALVAEQGLLSVTMSEIAEKTGIGRSTLYKYFPDVEAILVAWHQRLINGHLEHLARVRDRAGDAEDRLEAVLEAYAFVDRERVQHQEAPHAAELATFLHRDKHVAGALQQLEEMIEDLIIEAAQAGSVRRDISSDELAKYCLHALKAASSLPSDAAIRRLVTVTLDGLAPRGDTQPEPSGRGSSK